MPRIVDHQDRRAAVTEALWRVVRRSGIQAVSVRSVAAEAGVSPSALRHYFASQHDLLAFALEAVVERVEGRLVQAWSGLAGRAGARFVLEQFLPLDADRQAETEVYLAFIGLAHTDPGLRAIRDRTDTDTRQAIQAAVDLLAADGALGSGRDRDREADRLYALIDGLAMHGALMSERYPPDQLSDVLTGHLAELAADLPRPRPGQPSPPSPSPSPPLSPPQSPSTSPSPSPGGRMPG
jgi:AcrR family transcriptional regulator